ncbi:MAG: hypothetical protein HDT28_01225 [Clostridiales bacterium]|nr:hypothetical protein [Clostridiales bacterium]
MAEFHIKGLDRFAEHFKDFTENYIIVGGTACSLALGDVGIPFRVTKDIDMIITVEEISHEFGEKFWEFIKGGQYDVSKNNLGVPQYFRFKVPKVDGYPSMIELFARKQDIFPKERTGTFTPIVIDEEISSLSAILLDDEYYAFLKNGRQVLNGISVLAPTHLIAFKARAYADLMERKESGLHVDDSDLKKHKNDVFRLSQLLTGQEKVECGNQVRADIGTFFALIQDEVIDMKALGVPATKDEVMDIIMRIYQ